MASFAFNVFTGDEKLGNRMGVFTEKLVVCIHQFALTNCRRGLLCGNVSGTLAQPQLADTHTNGAGGNNNNLRSCIFNIADHLAQFLNTPYIQMAGAGVGQCTSADFNNDTHHCTSQI